MLSNRSYLLRAFYQWIVDSSCTPILVIDVNYPRCRVPLEYADGTEIVFNISPSAVRDFKISNETIEFKASFSGVVHIIVAPVKSILAVYAEENGEGIFFDAEEEGGESSEDVVQFKGADYTTIPNERDAPISKTDMGVKKGKPVLKLVE